MINVGEKSKLLFHWKVNPYDYSDDKVKDILEKVSKKYGVNKSNIRILPQFIMHNENGDEINMSNDLITNIQNPEFQLKLFKEYIELNNLTNVDFDDIKKIDSEINSRINFDAFDKLKRYSIKWIKWSNFLSYGRDNFFDFTTMKGLVLLNGEPANQSGKTTFAIDLLHFLLFGKTDKASTQDKIFNKWLKEETSVVVEGCLNIDGEDYVIKRTLTRPQFKKRTSKSKTTQKVEYYRLVENSLEELEEYVDNQQEENGIKTNKVIKDSIGNESDFDLIICATSTNLDDLIEKKDTERGRLLSRWIGLLPIENKEIVAKDKFNTEIKPYLVSNRYNVETLEVQKNAFNVSISDLDCEIEKFKKDNIKLDSEIRRAEEMRDTLLLAKQTINESAASIDITTLNASIENLTNQGLETKAKIEKLTEEINSIDVGRFSEDEYKSLCSLQGTKNAQIESCRHDYQNSKILKEALEKGEYCPTCGKKLDGVDNSAKIAEVQKNIDELVNKGKTLSKELSDLEKKIHSMYEARENFNLKSKLTINKSACEVQIAQLRNELREKKQLKKEFEANEEAIRKNNDINLKLRITDANLNGFKANKDENNRFISKLENEISVYKNNIKEIEETIVKIKEEEIIVRNWKVYLEMIGKNGISKMVLRKALPIINAQMVHLLSDVCDFNVEISITEKNEVNFSIIKDGIKSDISSGSGFEKTAAALALRFVLAKNSVLPKLNYIVLDEVLSRVANENLDNISLILDRIKDDYSFIFIVTHNEYFKEKANKIVTVSKQDNISVLNVREK